MIDITIYIYIVHVPSEDDDLEWLHIRWMAFFPAALAIIPMQDPGGRHSMGKAQRRADLGLWHGEFPALWEQKHWEVGKSNGVASYFPMTVSLIVDKFFIFRQIQYIPILLQVLIIDQPEIVCRWPHLLLYVD
jgi:hypothetical protein